MTRIACALISALLTTGVAHTQPAEGRWPERPIRLIVPFQAGSGSDVIARILSKGLAEKLGQQIIIDNRVGASATLGSDVVARSEPDGYTMQIANTTTHASATAMQAKP